MKQLHFEPEAYLAIFNTKVWGFCHSLRLLVSYFGHIQICNLFLTNCSYQFFTRKYNFEDNFFSSKNSYEIFQGLHLVSIKNVFGMKGFNMNNLFLNFHTKCRVSKSIISMNQYRTSVYLENYVLLRT